MRTHWIQFSSENTRNIENVFIGSMLGMRRAPRQVFQSTRPFIRIKIACVSVDPQTHVEIPEMTFENKLDKNKKNDLLAASGKPSTLLPLVGLAQLPP